MYRVSVAQPGRGPLNPMERASDPVVDRRDWNRFDTPGLTIYGADQRVTAFTESIAYKAPAAKNYAALSEEARFLGIRLTELLTDLRSAGIPIDGMEPDWRLNREIYRLEFPGRPWVDLTHPDTIIAIKTSDIAASDRMSVADLTGDDRALTTAVAQWIRAQQLDDGARPAGLKYPSKFGFSSDDYCWAGFLEKQDVDVACTGAEFSANDPDLTEAVRRTGVHVS